MALPHSRVPIATMTEQLNSLDLTPPRSPLKDATPAHPVFKSAFTRTHSLNHCTMATLDLTLVRTRSDRARRISAPADDRHISIPVIRTQDGFHTVPGPEISYYTDARGRIITPHPPSERTDVKRNWPKKALSQCGNWIRSRCGHRSCTTRHTVTTDSLFDSLQPEPEPEPEQNSRRSLPILARVLCFGHFACENLQFFSNADHNIFHRIIYRSSNADIEADSGNDNHGSATTSRTRRSRNIFKIRRRPRTWPSSTASSNTFLGTTAPTSRSTSTYYSSPVTSPDAPCSPAVNGRVTTSAYPNVPPTLQLRRCAASTAGRSPPARAATFPGTDTIARYDDESDEISLCDLNAPAPGTEGRCAGRYPEGPSAGRSSDQVSRFAEIAPLLQPHPVASATNTSVTCRCEGSHKSG